MTDDLDLIRCTPMPDDPDEVLFYVPFVGYLDAGAGSLEFGLERDRLPEQLAVVQAAIAGETPCS